MIYPNDPMKMWWDVLISIILIVSVFISPLELAFPTMTEEYPRLKKFLIVVDLFFLFDIITNFM
jgi:hypothetical protein